MSDKSKLLPEYATPLELALGSLEPDLSLMDSSQLALAQMNSPARASASFLPWLGWGRSVDSWDGDWAEETKRKIIDASYEVHRFKGTLRAVKAAVEMLNANVELIEWFEDDGAPGTFKLDVWAGVDDLSHSHQANLVDAVWNAKPLSREATLRIGVKGGMNWGVGAAATALDGVESWAKFNPFLTPFPAVGAVGSVAMIIDGIAR